VRGSLKVTSSRNIFTAIFESEDNGEGFCVGLRIEI
jgi:hypothetical protein